MKSNIIAIDMATLTIRVNSPEEITDEDQDVIGTAFAAAEEAAKASLAGTKFEVVGEYD